MLHFEGRSNRDPNFNGGGFPLPKGYCNVCRKPTTCRCKCGDFYCSSECLDKDWPRHRYNCLPMAPLMYAQTPYNAAHKPTGDNTFKQKNDASKGTKKMGSASIWQKRCQIEHRRN